MTELTAVAPVRTDRDGRRREDRTRPTPPSFPELIYAHDAWWRELRGDGITAETQAHYDEVRNAFQRTHGQIVRAYWCTHVESAVALTEQKAGSEGRVAASTARRTGRRATSRTSRTRCTAATSSRSARRPCCRACASASA